MICNQSFPWKIYSMCDEVKYYLNRFGEFSGMSYLIFNLGMEILVDIIWNTDTCKFWWCLCIAVVLAV